MTRKEWIIELAATLGVKEIPLRMLKPVYAQEHRAWAFVMRDGYNNMIGIRLRSINGDKWAVPGSHAGIFLPQCEITRTVLICEGPTDTAAGLSLGYFSIGRPSCSGGVPHICNAVKRLGITRAVIVADNDPDREVKGKTIPSPGLNGAAMLAKYLPIPSATLVLPTKDIREFVKMGGTSELLDCMINSLVWTTK